MEQSIHGEKTYVAFLLQGGLGLPDREHYLSADPGKQALRARYREYIGQMLALAGFDRADAARERGDGAGNGDRAEPGHAGGVGQRPQRRQRLDASRLRARAPGMDWSVFFDEAGLARQETFVVWQPTAVTGLAALVASQPLEAWKDYLRFHVIDDYADVLPRAFAEEALALRGAAGSGA